MMGVIQGIGSLSLQGFLTTQCLGARLGRAVKSTFPDRRETTDILYQSERPMLISRVVEGYAVLRDEAAC